MKNRKIIAWEKYANNIVIKSMNKKKSLSPVPPNSKKLEVLHLHFPEAILAVIGGRKVRRQEWSDPEEYCLMKDSFLMIHRGDKFHQWIVSEGDLLAIDWVVTK